MKITPILHILSILVMPLAGFMIISGLVDLFYSNVNWINFLSSAVITLFIGMSVFLATRTNRDQNLDLRQAFILTTLSWITIALFGAIGFLISGSYLKPNIPLSIGFLNIPAFLIFIPITTFMARIGARTVHTIDKNKISKYFGIFLLIIAAKFLYEYSKL